MKAQLGNKAPKTVNNVLTVLNTLLKTAVAWDVLDRMPCTVRLVPTTSPTAEFHDFPAYEALVTAAKADDPLTYLVVLLGGEAGLRCGEMMALQWRDVDLAKRPLTVTQSEWKGHVTAPKSGLRAGCGLNCMNGSLLPTFPSSSPSSRIDPNRPESWRNSGGGGPWI